MKLLHVSDLHFNQVQMLWVTDNASEADVVCLTGDFIDSRYNCPTPIDEQVAVISCWLTQFNRPIFVCSGNHDQLGDELNSTWLREIEGIYADHSIASINGVIFGSAPYGTSDFTPFSRCNVLLHHEPPSGLSVAKQSGRDFGSRDLTTAIKSGTLSLVWLLTGHVHQPEKCASKFRGCSISNPGANSKSEVPNHHWIRI